MGWREAGEERPLDWRQRTDRGWLVRRDASWNAPAQKVAEDGEECDLVVRVHAGEVAAEQRNIIRAATGVSAGASAARTHAPLRVVGDPRHTSWILPTSAWGA